MRNICLTLCLLVAATAGAPGAGEERPDLDKLLTFELVHEEEWPQGWSGGPAGTAFVDGDVVHGGKWSARLERDAGSEASFTTLTDSLPVDFGGRALELRGFLKTEDVVGWTGLWLRQDGEAGSVAFDNMQQRNVHGTTDWTEYTIELPLRNEARTIFFGALLAGEGKVWVDDLQLLVDGKPVSGAPAVERVETVLDTDDAFDAGSGIDIGELTPGQIERVAALGRIWGFLKYHHPAVTSLKFHWDYELFRILPRILEAGDRATANAVTLQWIRGLGELAPCDPCTESPEEFHLAADLDWIRDTEALGPELSAYLREVHRHRDPEGKQAYVKLNPGVGNPSFDREKGYVDLETLDAGYRLLALFRYWNIIQYWFPYRDVIGEDWHGVLAEFVPRMIAAREPDDYRLELLALVSRVHDGHANLWRSLDLRPPRGECLLPVRLRFVEDRPLVVGYTDETAGPASGLRIGDVLLGLDGASIPSLIEAWSPYYAASNQAHRRRGIARSMTRGACSEVTIKGERASGPFELTAKRLPAEDLDDVGGTHDLPGDTFRLLSKEVAYLKLSSVKMADAAGYVERAGGTRGLIVDIRNYPSEFMVFALGPRLVREPVPFARFTYGDLANPGTFLWTDPLVLTPVKPGYEGKVVVLVDESSMSQAEYTAMALRAGPGAIVVGSTTAGADGNVSPIPLPGGLPTMISGIGVFYPDKSPTQRVGILPDVEVRPTVRGLREGRDEVLEEAVRQILGPDADEKAVRKMTLGSGDAAAVEDRP